MGRQFLSSTMVGLAALTGVPNLSSVDALPLGGIVSKGINVLDEVNKVYDSYINKTVVGAQIVYSENGKEVLSKSIGKSDIISDKQMKIANTFNIASVSKLFIWTAVMQLKESGKLDLNKDIREYLPKDYKLGIVSKKPVTMLNLMNHNAGFEAKWIHKGSSGDFSSLGQAVCNCYSGIQVFNSGEIQGYSNYGANLAAYIVENVSGEKFYDYVESHIFKPCGMNCCYPERKKSEEILKNKATGYMKGKNGFEKTSVYSAPWLYPSGSVVCSASELTKFANALMPEDGQKSPLFLKKETLNEFLSSSYNLIKGKDLYSVHHGFWGSNGNIPEGMLYHTGYVEGMNSIFIIDPKKRKSLVVLTNTQGAMNFIYDIVRSIFNYSGPENSKDNYKFIDSKLLEGEYVNFRTSFVGRISKFETFKIVNAGENKVDIFSNKVKIGTCKQIQPGVFESVRSKGEKIYIYATMSENGKNILKLHMDKNDWIPLSVAESRNSWYKSQVKNKKIIIKWC